MAQYHVSKGDSDDHWHVKDADGSIVGAVVKVESGQWRVQDHEGQSLAGDPVFRTRDDAAAALFDPEIELSGPAPGPTDTEPEP